MDPTQNDATPGVTAGDPTLQDATERYLGAQDSGIYAANSEHILQTFREWAEGRSLERVVEIDKHVLTEYATRLRRRSDAGNISPATARNYYDVLSGWLTYCFRRDWLDTNPALKEAPKQELPAESDDPTRQQRWTKENRVEIVRWADWRAEDALDHGWMDGEVAVRDRALVAMLGYSGVRGAEILADSRDEDRNGLRWRDVDLGEGTMRILGKRRKVQHVALHNKAQNYLTAHKRRQQPETDAWPVFITGHAPSLYDGLPDDADPDIDVLDAYREYGEIPPSLSTNGGRTILERLSLESGIRGTDGEVLKPHAARRGLGHDLYRKAPEKAQETLRHQDIETTHEHYTDVRAADRKRDLDELID